MQPKRQSNSQQKEIINVYLIKVWMISLQLMFSIWGTFETKILIFHTFSQIFAFLAKWTLKYKIEALEILTIIITIMLIIATSYCHLLKTYLL